MNGEPNTLKKVKLTEASSPENPRAYFDITIGDEKIGRVVFELFKNITPKTCNNFLSLCSGSATTEQHGVLTYKGSTFHRVIKGFMCQGGDFTAHNGTGGVSIYGDRFEDENFQLDHETPGLLSMANAGPNTNGSQFFITTAPTPHLNGKHVVFGRVIKGMNVVRFVEDTPKGDQDRPIQPVVIASCGVLAAGEPDGILPPTDGDIYEDFPGDMMNNPEPLELLDVAVAVKALGNTAFKQGNLQLALKKYSKTLRYLDAVHPAPEDVDELTMDQKKAIVQTRASTLLNTSMCELKLERFAGSVESSDRVLHLAKTLSTRKDELAQAVTSSELTKAYFRKSMGLKGLKDLDKALESAKMASQLSPEDKLISREVVVIQKAIQDREAKEKAIYSRMFA